MIAQAVLGLALLIGAVAAVPPAEVQAAGHVLYVDGKLGNDGNPGTSVDAPLKTIAHAAAVIPKGAGAAGWTVVVQGYTDYVYRERPIPTGWDRAGAPGAPIVFEAAGYAAGPGSDYVKPIVSGADAAPMPGRSWSATSTDGVWSTAWSSAPFGYGHYSGSLRTALFQDTATWLWEQSSRADLGSRAAAGKGGYWYDSAAKRLYVSAKGQGDNRNPALHTVDVVMRNAFLFIGTNGVTRVEVRGFEVRHAANGIAFTKGVDYSTAADNRVIGNLLMGIQTSGAQRSSGPDPATGNSITGNEGAFNTIQAIKIDEGSVATTVCDNVIHGNGLQGIKVQGAPGGTGYTGRTSGITVCRNDLYGQTFNPTGSAYSNASGITIANGAQQVTVEGNSIHGNSVGIHVTQESSGRRPIDGLVLRNNLVSANRRFGIYFFDGAKGATSGTGTAVSDHDVLWGNGIGIMVARGSTHKTVLHATVHGNIGDGIKVGEAGKAAATLVVRESLVTANGGYGLWLVTGNKTALKYTGLSGNHAGNIKGKPSKTAVNTKAAGYLSLLASAEGFLQVPPTSYQYTAGPYGTPVGARY